MQEILSDKQSRGAFGQERMEAIVADQLPPDQYDFQFTLSNGNRPDCVIRIPNVQGVIVVDSKFPLEAFETLRGLATDEDRKQATARLKADVQKHVKDIAEKYLIPGEMQTPAIMFVPSESIYAELLHLFGDVVQQARRAQVVIMSPHVLMLAINTIQTLMKDAKMREQAYEIQKEVGVLLQDVKRLGERVGNLRQHFDRTEQGHRRDRNFHEGHRPPRRTHRRGETQPAGHTPATAAGDVRASVRAQFPPSHPSTSAGRWPDVRNESLILNSSNGCVRRTSGSASRAIVGI